jgi:hypothetical protein
MHPSAQSPQGPPPPFRLTSSGAVEWRSGGGFLAAVGVPVLLGGIVMALGALGVIPLKDEFDHRWTGPYLIGMSALFLALGATFTFGRRSLIIDPFTGSLTRSYSLLARLRTVQRSLVEFNAVLIDFQRGGSESPDCYPVRLRAITGKNLTISSPTDFGQARQQAEFLSRLLRFPLADATTDHEVVLTPELAGASLQERSSSAVGPAEPLATPPAMRSRVSELGHETIITIPKRMSPAAGAAAGIVACLMLLIVAPVLWRLMSPGDSHSGPRLIFFAFLIFFFGILPLVASATAFGLIRNQVVVTASPAGLIIERQGMSRVRSETIPASEILDLDYSTMQGILGAQRAAQRASLPGAGGQNVPRVVAALGRLVPNKGIIVKTRRALISLGEGLSSDELCYLARVLKRSLAASR